MSIERFRRPTLRGIPLGSALRLLCPSSRAVEGRTQHIFLCIADHYEPFCGGASKRLALERVDRWVREYPLSVAGLEDSIGRSPQHTFFYPAEEYDGEVIERLAGLARQDFGDVEVHLHHDGDSSQNFRDTLSAFTERLYERHGLLRRDAHQQIRYGFIHGNWALDNARPDGRWCGVNDEISILQQSGCYADFTLPCAPEPGQTRTINSIYYAVDDPQRPMSHDRGIPVCVGRTRPPEGLLLIQGPLAWNWQQRKRGIFPRLENGDLHGENAPTLSRFRLWRQMAPRVRGRPDWIFIKLHTHGALEMNTKLFLAGPARKFHQELARLCQTDRHLRYYYVTAHEMANLVHQAERGEAQPVIENRFRAS